jgi:drug/metabolite transporter (DMT)-like permease
MPWLFVLIWSTGFVVARLAMPHAPPFGFLTIRFALSAACFVVWIAIAAPPGRKGAGSGSTSRSSACRCRRPTSAASGPR